LQNIPRLARPGGPGIGAYYGAKGAQEKAQRKAAKHATPTTAHFDSLGRPFLTLAHNGFKLDGTAIEFPTRVKLDIEGNSAGVMLLCRQGSAGTRRQTITMTCSAIASIRQAWAGERWMLNV
jgi:hypothetical protein